MAGSSAASGRLAGTARARDVLALLEALQTSDPGRPRVTWYGPDGERVELSARVLLNWVVKTANLLGDELGCGPGDRVELALPGHWRTVVWQLAVAVVGCEPVSRTGDPAMGDGADVRVVADPGAARSGDVLVALAALARSAPDLPAGVLDYNAEVGPQPDVLAVAVEPTPLPPAVAPGACGIPSAAPDVDATPPRVMVHAGATAAPLAEVVLPTLRQDGSLVLVHADVDPEPLVGPEQVTRRWSEAPGIS